MGSIMFGSVFLTLFGRCFWSEEVGQQFTSHSGANDIYNKTSDCMDLAHPYIFVANKAISLAWSLQMFLSSLVIAIFRHLENF